MAVIFYFSSLPPREVPSISDFIPHFIEYFILGVLTSLTLREHLSSRAFSLASFWGLFYAFTDELHQLYVPGRQATLKDWLVDALGVLVGVLVVRFYYDRSLKKEKSKF